MGVLDKLKKFVSGEVPKKSDDAPVPVSDPVEAEFVALLVERWRNDMGGSNQAHPRFDEYLERWRQQHRLPFREDYRNNLRGGKDFSKIETQVALAMASLPKPEISPEENPALEILGPVWQAILEDWSTRTGFPEQWERAIRVCELNGDSTPKVTWDQSLCGGIGDIKVEVKDPRNIVVDHEASSWDDRKRLTEIEYFTPQSLLATFGDRVRGMTASDQTEGGIGSPSETAGGTGLERIRVIRQWWEDLTTVDVPVFDGSEGVPVTESEAAGSESPDVLTEQDGTPPQAVEPGNPKVPQRLYPSGRVSVFTDDERLLFDEKNPYPWWPHERLYNYSDPFTAGGISEYDLMASLTDTGDNFLSNIADHMDQLGSPKMVCPTNVGFDPRQMTGQPGEVLPANPGTGQEIRYLEPPQVQQWIRDFPDQLDSRIDRVTGIEDVLQGGRPSGLETFATLQALRESGLTRLARKTKQWDQCYSRILWRVIYLMQTRYHTERKLRVSGEAGQRLRQIAESPEFQQQIEQISQFPEESPIGALPVEVLKFIGNSGNDFYFTFIASGLKGAMNVKAERGSIISMTQSEVAAMAINLAQLQIGPNSVIDERAVLDAVQFPRREQILQRRERARMAQAQAQAMQAQQQMPPQSPAVPQPPQTGGE